MKDKVKKGILIVIAVILIVICCALIAQYVRALTQEVKNPVVNLEIENYGNVKIELYPEYAPNTVKNIIRLVEKGYYDGKVFYGTDDISVYVGRNAEGEISYPKLSTIKEDISEDNDYEYEINGEFVANGFEENTLKHEKGVVSLVRADYTQVIGTLKEESFNSGSSQFTILTEDARNLNGMYAGFGRVIEGMDIVENIYNLDKASKDENAEDTETSSIEKFATMPVIIKATVETNGVDYGEPEIHEAFDYQAYLQQLLTQYYSENNN
ncbi:MAG: peptidylprolyl isomerase [Candidatus Scatovivens sp.]